MIKHIIYLNICHTKNVKKKRNINLTQIISTLFFPNSCYTPLIIMLNLKLSTNAMWTKKQLSREIMNRKTARTIPSVIYHLCGCQRGRLTIFQKCHHLVCIYAIMSLSNLTYFMLFRAYLK